MSIFLNHEVLQTITLTDHGGSVYSKVETNQLFCRAILSGSFRFHSD